MDRAVVLEDIKGFKQDYLLNTSYQLAQNAVTTSGIAATAFNRAVASNINHVYSNLIETPEEATSQMQSGRCWIFAALNSLRHAALSSMNVDKFEFSQAYMMFWDKFEKANYFLETVIETLDQPIDSRIFMWLMTDPTPDGGQWDMFVNLVEKYGLIPKNAMLESFSSSNSATMNQTLHTKLREYAMRLRRSALQGVEADGLRKLKNQMMSTIYRILVIHLGMPPERFYLEWRDKDKLFHTGDYLTPHEFRSKYVDVNLDDMICLINAPTPDKPLNRSFTVQYLGNVVGGHPVRYLNVDINTIKEASKAMIIAGIPVWFGCDVGRMLDRNSGLLDKELYDYELVYGEAPGLGKSERLLYGDSRMTHAMALTGVDIDGDGKPRKWRVENSWGPAVGEKGYMVMSDNWFDEYLYEVTVRREFVPSEVLKALEEKPIILPPWDPMGALA